MRGLKGPANLLKSMERLESQGLIFDLPGISVTAIQAKGLKVEKRENAVTVFYNKKTEFFKGLSIIKENLAKNGDYTVECSPRFKEMSIMLDMSRASVYSIEGFKKTVKILSALGYDTIQLYTEDTYEIPGEPYFGHMRGRLTASEIKAMDSICADLGIELMPCIQTLAHLEHMFKWPRFLNNVWDVQNILLIGNEETYALIDKMFATLSANFTSRRVNIGMDEAHLVGLGKYLDKNGYKNRFELLSGHLKRVLKIAGKYGFKVSMWSDMYFRLVYNGRYHAKPDDPDIPDAVIESVPPEVTLIYWDYYHDNKQGYDLQIKKHKKFKNNISFAGGAWRWFMFAPRNRMGLKHGKAALEACLQNGIEAVMVTVWGDDGSECPVLAALPQLVLYSQFNYFGDASLGALKRAMRGAADANYQDFMLLDELSDASDTFNGACKFLLYNDPMAGIMDFYAYEQYGEYYAALAKKLKAAGNRNVAHADMFESFTALALALSLKANLGNELIAAYKKGDRTELKALADIRIPKTIKAVDRFLMAFRKQWLMFNKPFGLELHSLRIGGLKQRLFDTQQMVNAYLKGDIAVLEELEQPRLSFIDANEQKQEGRTAEVIAYCRIASAGMISY